MEKKSVERLFLEKKYDEIYKLYGSEKYRKYTPIKIQNDEISKLLSDGKFLEVYEKFGELKYNRSLLEIQKKDIERELGCTISFFNVPLLAINNSLKIMKTKIFKEIASVSYYLMIAILLSQVSATSGAIDNEIIYESNIQEYNREIEQYAEYIRSINLSELEIIMKVMNDIHSNIEYKDSDTFDSLGILRLSLYENGHGVCRNIADDYTARLNAINPSFKATNLIIYLKDNPTEISLDNSVEKIVGNHMVTCITTSDGNNLVVDPTNALIGILKNGKVYLYNDSTVNLELSVLGQNFTEFKTLKEAYEKILKSFLTDGTYEELMEEYGIIHQEQAFENIRDLDTSHYHTK